MTHGTVSTPGANSTLCPSCHNQKSLRTLSGVPGEAKWSPLRTPDPEGLVPSSEVPALQKQAGSSPCTGTSQPQRPRSRGRHSNASPDVRGPRFVQRELQSEPSQCRRAEQAGRQPTLGWHVGPQGGWKVESRRGWGAKAECVILDVGWEQGRCEREGQRPGLCLLAPRVAPLEGGSAEAGRPTEGHPHSPQGQRGHGRGLGGASGRSPCALLVCRFKAPRCLLLAPCVKWER